MRSAPGGAGASASRAVWLRRVAAATVLTAWLAGVCAVGPAHASGLPTETVGADGAPDPTTDPGGYIGAVSRYGWKAVCVSDIETGHWTMFYNRSAWHGEHAQGYFGWLPSTFYGIAPWGSIGDLDAEIDAFDAMLDARRGGEFYGLGGYTFVDGTGPCYRRR